MTDQQYKDLQAWCQKKSNKALPEYQKRVELRNEASQVKAAIRGYNVAIKQATFFLEACKDQAAIDKWTSIINKHRADKAVCVQYFKLL